MSLLDLYKMDYTLTKIDALSQTYWCDGQAFTMAYPRPTNAFLYVESGRVEAQMRDGTHIEAPAQSVLFVPKGAQYTLTFHGEEGAAPRTLLFEFVATVAGTEPDLGDSFVVGIFNYSARYEEMFAQIADEVARPVSIPAVVKTQAYGLLNAILSELSETHYVHSSYGTIMDGIAYLENDIYQKLSIQEIAAMCFVSVSYFERLFRRYAGMTPSQYRIKQKINRSLRLLQSPEGTLEQIAEELGFYDGAHFCRCFKKETGMTPKEYRRTHTG